MIEIYQRAFLYPEIFKEEFFMVTVGAVLKKIAIGLLSHPKSWKVVGGIVLGLIVILVTPLAMITAVFNGDIEIDRDRPYEMCLPGC